MVNSFMRCGVFRFRNAPLAGVVNPHRTVSQRHADCAVPSCNPCVIYLDFAVKDKIVLYAKIG